MSVLYSARKCPDFPDGGHRMEDKGYWPMYCAHRYECSCGRWELGNTDEWRCRMEIS